MSKRYVDNAMNRSLGRVGMAHGTAVHSRSSGGSGSYGGTLSGSYGGTLSGYGGSTSSSYSSPRSGTYVDNSHNRSLGRVGMTYGSAVNSRASNSSSSSKTYVDNPLNRNLGRVGLEHGTAVHRAAENSLSLSSSSSSSKTYADNPLNRSLGRVGLEHGKAVHRAAESSHGLNSSGSSSKTYADNPLNRSLGRVGLEHGKAVHRAAESSHGSSSSSKTYADNPLNRSLGRVGLELGTAVHRAAESSHGSVGSSKSRTDATNLQNARVYKDNYFNRKLGRVGQPIQNVQNKGQEQQEQLQKQGQKVYVDNEYNRKHNRVGKPKGSAPVPKEKNVYKDTPLNRAMGRVGQPWGTFKGKPQEEMMSKLNRVNFNDEVPDDIVERYGNDTNTREVLDALLEAMNREGELRRRAEEVSDCEELDAYQHTSKTVMDNYKGQAIDFKISTPENQDATESEDIEASPECAVKSYKGKIISFDELNMSGKKIGHGNFGDVFSAEWTEGQLVAVKVLRHQQMANKRVKQFEKEISLYCKLDHPNIVSFIGACVIRPNLAFVMEFMEMSLRDALDVKEVDFDNKEKVNMTKGISKGLTYLHLKNIAHCDFKPSNILLNNVPGGEMYDSKKPVLAKLTDFGLSLIKADTESTSSNIDSVKNVGTPKYSAPEVLRGDLLNVNDMKMADVYSMALTVLELLLEEAPFENLNVMQLRTHVGEKGLKPKMTNGSLLDADFKSYIDECLSSQASTRPTADDFTSYVSTKSLLLI